MLTAARKELWLNVEVAIFFFNTRSNHTKYIYIYNETSLPWKITRNTNLNTGYCLQQLPNISAIPQSFVMLNSMHKGSLVIADIFQILCYKNVCLYCLIACFIMYMSILSHNMLYNV